MANKPSIQEYVALLKANRNLILTGAPGTGKTYLAKQIAMQIIGEESEEKEKEQLGFVQFHPSYDYTDFVEGLRPINGLYNNEIGFELKNGIFKDFCKKAKRFEFIQSHRIDNFDEAWEKFSKEVVGKTDYNIKIIRGTNVKVKLKENIVQITVSSGNSYSFSKDLCYELYKGLSYKNGMSNYMKATIKHLKEKFDLKDYSEKNDSPKNYIFIIDEINRGEISKIFGELFFSIDPGYRGKKGKVKTQYQNMSDDYDDDFYVPENVFIIGTMNDIDRSVESFDFAMRRRFVWKEITAAESAENMGLSSDTKKIMASLNKAIEKIEGLNASYHIGGAYFLKLKEYNNDYKELWNLHLKPLLFEYLRGTQDAIKNLEILENAYNLKEVPNADNG